MPIKDDGDRKQVLELFRESLLMKVAEKELKGKISVSAQEIGTYYQENAAVFDMVRGRRLLIRSEASNYFFGDNRPKDQTVSDDEARARADKLRREIQDGADFEVMAAKHTEDPLTSGVGGDTGHLASRTSQQDSRDSSRDRPAVQPGGRGSQPNCKNADGICPC